MTMEQAAAQIRLPDTKARDAARRRLDTRAKLPGSLGLLEDAVIRLAGIQRTAFPRLDHKLVVVVCADNGVTAEGISPSAPTVTAAQAVNFARGGGTINAFARRLGAPVRVVDVGIATPYTHEGVERRTVRRGTDNMAAGPAMSAADCRRAVEVGITLAEEAAASGAQLLIPGEMGIGNTSASSMWMTCLTGTPLEQCVGAGSGLGSAGVRRKCHVLRQALDGYAGDRSVEDVMRWFGGYEMVMAVGAMLQAAELGMVILVDGFIMTNCMLAASKLYPEVLNYAVFAHRGDESGHALLLDAMGAKPLLDLGLRLGEGTGAVCAYPIVESAVRMLAEMASFGDAGVTKYF